MICNLMLCDSETWQDITSRTAKYNKLKLYVKKYIMSEIEICMRLKNVDPPKEGYWSFKCNHWHNNINFKLQCSLIINIQNIRNNFILR